MTAGELAGRDHLVLVLAPTASDTRIAVRLLGRSGIAALGCESLDALCAEVTQGAGVVLLAEELLARDRAGSFAEALDGQEAWSDLPVLVLARGGTSWGPTRGLDRFTNVTLIDRPVRMATLVSTVRGALRARVRQYQTRAHLAERARSAAALAASEARYRVVGETIPYGAWIAEADGRFRFVSDAFLQLLGVRLDEVRARTWQALLPEGQREVAVDEWRAAIGAGVMFDLEYALTGADGEARIVLVRGVPIRDDAGRITSWVGINLDVTDRRRFDAEVERIGRLDSVALLAGGIAHDFNNILTAILANISLARRHVPDGERAAGRLEAAERACTQAQSLTRQLLTFAKGGAPVRQLVDVGKVVHEALGFALQGSAVRGEIAIQVGVREVHADPGQIAQVVHNLVLNGAQAMGGKGVVRVEVKHVEIPATTTMPLAPGPYVSVAVADHGVGIPADTLARIFDLFYTTKTGGSGLGLAIAHSVVKRHGGHITVRSTTGVGTTFQFFLPCAVADTTGQAEAPAKEERRLRVLVMDDDGPVRDAACAILDALGHDVDAVADGARAVALYEEQRALGRPFDLVLLDLTVPGGMGGREAMARLRDLDPGVRGVVASGYSSDPVMADCARYGFWAAVAKPYGVDQLEDVLQRAVLEREG